MLQCFFTACNAERIPNISMLMDNFMFVRISSSLAHPVIAVSNYNTPARASLHVIFMKVALLPTFKMSKSNEQ